MVAEGNHEFKKSFNDYKKMQNPIKNHVKVQSIAMTFSRSVEDDRSLSIHGDMASHGHSVEQLKHWYDMHRELGFKCELHRLGPEAYVLVTRDVFNSESLCRELINVPWDAISKRTKMYGKWLDKIARVNTCITDGFQIPSEGVSSQVPFSSMPECQAARGFVGCLTGIEGLYAEINYYPEKNGFASGKKCGEGYIGFHGDAERLDVIGSNMGPSPRILVFRPYCNGQQNGPDTRIVLQPGDMYIMSEKATGFDWKNRKIQTYRHAAGSEKSMAKIMKDQERKAKKQAEAKAAKQASRKREREIQEEIVTAKRTKCSATFVDLNGKKALQFYSKSKFPDAKYLSNFTEYNGTSVEKEFCKAKYDFCQVECPDLTGLTGAEVKKLHGKKHLVMSEMSIASWNHESYQIMYGLIYNRCANDQRFADLLTKYKYFLHQENRSRKPFWGGRVTDGILIGKNKLGLIMEEVAQNL
jgi:opacity protein-like surface antigen